MTLRLKDRKLEEKLLAIDPDFLQRVRTIDNVFYEPKENIVKGCTSFVFEICTNKRRLGEVVFSEDDIEHIPEYNPHAWNDFPLVTPPEGVLMRVETDFISSTFRDCAIFEDGIWHCERDGVAYGALRGQVKRFRPWEDQ